MDIRDFFAYIGRSLKSSPIKKKVERIVSTAWEVLSPRSVAQFFTFLWVSGRRKMACWFISVKSRRLKFLAFKKLWNLIRRSSFVVINSIISFTTVSCVTLKSFVFSSTKSIKTKFDRWGYKTFKKPTGIAFVCGLDAVPQINEAVKILIPDLPLQFKLLSTPISSSNKAPIEHIRLFFGELTGKEYENINKVRILVENKSISINDVMDLMRVWVGDLFLLKKALEKREGFAILSHVLTPQECRYLRKLGFFLCYISVKDVNYETRYCRGLTYGSLHFDKYYFETPTKEEIEILIRGIYFGKEGIMASPN